MLRLWTLNGISARLIESHYEHNYGSAVVRLNAVTEELKRLDIKRTPAPVIGRLKQEQTMLLNSMLLHELYFASLGGDGRAPTKLVSWAIARDFGSVDRWRAEFMALAEALGGDAGWIILTYVPREGRMINVSPPIIPRVSRAAFQSSLSICTNTLITSSAVPMRRHT